MYLLLIISFLVFLALCNLVEFMNASPKELKIERHMKNAVHFHLTYR